MSLITTTINPRSLVEGIKHIFGDRVDLFEKEYPDLYEIESSEKNFEEDVAQSGFGFGQKKPEGMPIRYDYETQFYKNIAKHDEIANGFIVSNIELEDNLYDKASKRRSLALADSMMTTKEQICANPYNRGFSASYTYGDGKKFFTTDHPVLGGSTFSNTLTTPADLSEAAVENIGKVMYRAKTFRGLPMKVVARSLIVPPELSYTANRIVKSTLQSSTANNAINAIAVMGMFPEGVKINHYLTSAKSWFIKTKTPGVVLYERRALMVEQDNDFDTSNLKVKATERYIPTVYDPRGAFGVEGIS